ncbi:MAG: ABC transporter substrate-binding protein [Thermomicrobiales bacterium]|nr:ABC transporter substrate-binding protein [Thermomicrobiales bacterium]
MTLPSISRRSALIGAAAFGLLVRNNASAQSTPEADAFPVTIEHLYGSTTIEKAPERILTIGWSTQDAVIALGETPIAIPDNSWGGDADGFLPWTRAALDEANLPVVYTELDGLPFEQFIELAPDLILAPYSGVTEDDYKLLAAIAPTVAPAEGLWASSWQDLTLVTGAALGKPTEAEQLIIDVDTTVQEGAAAYPELAGKTFIYGNMGDASTSFNIYTVTDPRPQFLESIGLVPAEVVVTLSDDPANIYFGPVSYELAETLVADITVFWFTDEAEYEAAQATEYFQALPAAKNGTFAAIVGQSLVMATSAFSPLSIPYALEAFLPVLAAAAANVE